MRKVLISVAIVLLLFVVLLFTFTGPADEASYQQNGIEALMLQRVDSMKIEPVAGDTMQIGWAKLDLLPDHPTPMAPSEARDGKHFTKVEDTIYVRAFVFDNGKERAAYVTADLLIIPPSVTAILKERLPEVGLSLDHVLLTATHTHSSIGGWVDGYVGGRFAGAYDPTVETFIADRIIESLRLADADKEPARIGMEKIPMWPMVVNRLAGNKGTTDPYIRMVRVQKDSGENGLIVSYAAHATCLPDTFMYIHRDYPAYLTKYLRTHPRINFVAFSAGAVGSMGPALGHLGPWGQQEQLAADLFHASMQIWNHMDLEYQTEIATQQVPIMLREPNYKVSDLWRIRPWVFKELFGDVDVYMSQLRIGDIVFISTPCDFSGELVAPIDSLATAQGKKLMIHSFNGGYCGYITRDKWQKYDSYETRTMNWYGPNSGSYFGNIINAMVEQ